MANIRYQCKQELTNFRVVGKQAKEDNQRKWRVMDQQCHNVSSLNSDKLAIIYEKAITLKQTWKK